MPEQRQDLSWLPDPPKGGASPDLSWLPDQPKSAGAAADLSWLPDQKKDNRSFVAKAMDTVFTPLTDLPKRVMDRFADMQAAGVVPFGGAAGPAISRFAGEALTQMTSPGDLALTAATLGTGTAARMGGQAAARGVQAARTVLGGGLAARGTERLVTGDSPAAGVVELAAGLAEAIPGGRAVVNIPRQIAAREAAERSAREAADAARQVAGEQVVPGTPVQIAKPSTDVPPLRAPDVFAGPRSYGIQPISDAEFIRRHPEYATVPRRLWPEGMTARSFDERLPAVYRQQDAKPLVDRSAPSPIEAPVAAAPDVPATRVGEQSALPGTSSSSLPPDATPREIPKPGTVDATRRARTFGANIPAQQPLSPARIAGEKRFLETQPEPFRDGLSEILENNRHFESQRRGVQPLARTEALANWIQVERKKALPRGTALNAEELTAYKNAVATSMNRATELSELMRGGQATDVQKIQHATSVVETIALLSNAMGARAETGRAMNALKLFAQVGKTNDLQAYESLVKAAQRYGLDLNKVATEFAALTDDVSRMNYLRGLQKSGTLDWVKGYWYSNILSGPKTHLKNVLGNTSNLAFRSIAHTAAYGVDVARSAVTRSPRTIFASEVGARLHGTWVGLKQGLDDAKFAMQNGFTRTDLGTFDLPRKELPGGLKNPLNYTGRALEAEDQFFYAINYKSELYARLYAKARQAGLKGKALTDQVAEWTLSPPRDVNEAAVREATRGVFKDAEGKWVKGVTSLKKFVPQFDFVMPFTRTPMNIIRQGIEATPLGVLTKQTREAIGAGGRDSAEAIGRMATGTTALAGIAWWFGVEGISGTGPQDSRERAALMENGWKPNSVKIGDRWVGFTDIAQPLAQPLFAMANAYDVYRRDGKEANPVHVLTMAGKSILDQSFLAGVSDLNNALSDPERYADQFLSRWTQSLVPFSGAMRNVAQAIDPVVREPRSLMEAPADSMVSIIPGASKSVPPKLGRLGQEIEREGGAFRRGISPIIVGSPSQDPVVRELSRYKVTTLGLPVKDLQASGRFPAIELTIGERQQIGQATREALESLFSDPSLSSLPEQDVREMVKKVVQQARARATQDIRLTRESNARR